jgi:hypothetical protein
MTTSKTTRVTHRFARTHTPSESVQATAATASGRDRASDDDEADEGDKLDGTTKMYRDRSDCDQATTRARVRDWTSDANDNHTRMTGLTERRKTKTTTHATQ